MQAAAEIIVATPSSACHISLAHQRPVELEAADRNPWGAEYPYQSVNSAEGASDPGENFRVLPMQHPVLLLAYASPSSLLLVGLHVMSASMASCRHDNYCSVSL